MIEKSVIGFGFFHFKGVLPSISERKAIDLNVHMKIQQKKKNDLNNRRSKIYLIIF